MDMINVMLKKPGAPWAPAKVENRLESLQQLVGGYIEVLMTHRPDVALIVDEEGKLKGKASNFYYFGDVIVGTAVLVGVDGEEFADCPVTTDQELLQVVWGW